VGLDYIHLGFDWFIGQDIIGLYYCLYPHSRKVISEAEKVITF